VVEIGGIRSRQASENYVPEKRFALRCQLANKLHSPLRCMTWLSKQVVITFLAISGGLFSSRCSNGLRQKKLRSRLESLRAATPRIAIFCEAELCICVDTNQRYEKFPASISILPASISWNQFPPKNWYTSTKIYDVTSQKTITTVRHIKTYSANNMCSSPWDSL